MIKKCPKCGSEKIKDQSKCPECDFEPQQDELTQLPQTDGNQSLDETAEEVYPDSIVNDPIEWSELKDLPLESVMELFDSSDTSTESKDDQVDKKENINLGKEKTETDHSATSEQREKAQQKKRVAELKEAVNNEEENSILAAYIKAHREDTTEEHAKELLRMIETAAATGEDSVDIRLSENTTEQVSPEKSQEDAIKEPPVEEPTEETIIEDTVVEDSSTSTEEQVDVITNIEETAPVSTEGPVETTEPIEEESSKVESTKAASTDAPQPKEAPETTELVETQPEQTKVEEQETSNASIKKEELPNDRGSKKSKKRLYLTSAAVLLLGAGGWMYYDHQQKVQAEIAAETQRKQDKMADLQSDLAAFYSDDDEQFIRTSMINQDLSKLRASLNEVKDEKGYADLEKTFEDIQSKIKQIQTVNEWFVTPVIADDQLIAEPKLKADQAIQSFETEDTAFGQLIDKATDEATKQYQQLQTAKEKTAVIYADGQVKDSATKEQYDTAKAEVAKVKNTELVKALVTELDKVDEALTKKEEAKKAEEAKQAQAQAEAQAQAQAEAAAQQTEATQTTPATNSANRPIMETRASDVADASNPAWNWAPGVKESVIATSIARGYIVEGGYRLEKARIENGEGYYNLYATSTKSSLMNGIGESALPFYIVTINCKTGWFGGNGSN